MWLERLMLSIAQNQDLAGRLALSGGTGLNKLWLPNPARYSEDLDYVCVVSKADDLLDDARSTALECGLLPAGRKSLRRKSPHPKVLLKFRSVLDGSEQKIKMEIADPHPALDLGPHIKHVERQVSEEWLASSATITTISPAYMAAMKLRAIYSRAKGRDLFDFYHLVTTLGVKPEDLFDLLEHAKLNEPSFHRWSATTNAETMKLHLRNPSSRFLMDLEFIAPGWAGTAVFDEALRLNAEFAERIHQEIRYRKAHRDQQHRLRGYPVDPSWTTDRLADDTARGQRSTKYDKARARRLKRSGMTNAQIAQKMGVSTSWVQRHTAGTKKGH